MAAKHRAGAAEAARDTVGASGPALRLMSYNIRSLRDDPAAVARVIKAAQPDVVCIQEAPRFARWRSTCAALARHSGMVVVGGGRPAGANLILSTLAVDVLATRDVLLGAVPGLHRRGAALALMSLRGSRFAVAGTHLDLLEQPRLQHVAELHREIERFVPAGVGTVVAGDVNDLPGSTTWRDLAAARTDVFATVGDGDGFTYSATDPTRRIDAVFADPIFGLKYAEVPRGPEVEIASDHRPLVVDLVLPS